MSRRIPPCLLLIGLFAGPTAADEASAPFLVRDIETEGVPAPDYDCPLSGPCPPVYGSFPSQLTPFGDRLAFVAFDAAHGVEPWITDGTAEGTRRLADLVPGEVGSEPCILGAVGGRLLLAAPLDTGASLRLLASAGDTVVPFHRTSARCVPLGGDGPLRPAVGGRIVYELEERVEGERRTRLWTTDGVAREPLATLCPFAGEPYPGRSCTARVEQYVVLRDDLFLVVVFNLPASPEGSPAVSFSRLYRLAPGAGDLDVVAETCPGNPTLTAPAVRDGAVYVQAGCLAALPGSSGLFRIDGDEVRHLRESSGWISPANPPVAGGRFVYFVLENFEITTLWRTDGTRQGTEEVLGGFGFIVSLPVSLGDRLLFTLNGRLQALLPDDSLVSLEVENRLHRPGARVPAGLAFAGYSSDTGDEPWITDGTPEGTRALGEVAPGPDDSLPDHFTQAGGLLYFSAETEDLGRELWAVRVGDEPAPAPPPPSHEWIESPAFPDFRFQVRIGHGPGALPIPGAEVLACQDDTVCVSGAVPGRPEVYLRILGPRPNGLLWPTIIRFTPSRVEVWVEQEATGQVNYYELPPVGPGDEDLSGRQDRRGFQVP